MSVTRTVLSTMFAALFGVLSGASLVGLPTYFSKECGFIGCDYELAPYLAIHGAICGVVAGACIGLIVTGFKLDAIMGAFAGGGVGLAVMLFAFRDSAAKISGGWIPIGAIIGLTVGLLNHRAV